MDAVETWVMAVRAFADLIEQIPDDRWDGSGLGSWSLRDLVGHTCSAGLKTVTETLNRPAETEDIMSAEAYYAFARTVDPSFLEAAIAASTEDARHAGKALGDRPAATVWQWAVEAIAAARAAPPDLLVASAAGGMRLTAWLSTRTFELAVHSLDIATATKLTANLPPQVTADAAALAARIATAVSQGESVLLALSGRGHLPDGFSVV